MPEPKLLPMGAPEPDDERILDEGLRRVEQRIADKKKEFKQLESMISVTAAKLRTLHMALTAFFSETADPAMNPSVASADSLNMPPNAAAWAAWKQRLPEPTGRIIDALMIQPLTQTQIATQARIHTTNVSKYMAPLKGNSLVEQDGSKWRLKRL